MSENEKKSENTKEPQSASQELFDKIFRAKLEAEKVKPLNEGKSVKAQEPLSDSLEMFDTLFQHELEKEKAAPKKDMPSVKKSSRKKEGKSSSHSKLILLALLIVILAGASLYYSGIVERSMLGRKHVVSARKASRPPKRPIVARSKIPPKPKISPRNIGKPLSGRRPVPAKAGPAQEKAGKEVPAPKTLSKAPGALSAAKIQGSEAKVIPAKEKSGVVPNVETAKAEKQRHSLLPEKRVLYPYSIYLGSFKSKKRVEKAIVAYQKVGLSPYRVRVDLGPKGIWYRVFAGHFRSREEARAFLNRKKIPDAEVKHTRYAVLVGSYPSLGQADKMKSRLTALGYDPYTVRDRGQEVSVYVGAFYRKERAEKLGLDLASRKIKGRVVQR